MTAASPSTPSGLAANFNNEGDRSRATKTRQLHPLTTHNKENCGLRLRQGFDLRLVQTLQAFAKPHQGSSPILVIMFDQIWPTG
ncbi:MAG: hypothetical protein WB646_03765, partial [Steroidobacteraceae bacterium]